MSSYLVSEKTMRCIVTEICHNRHAADVPDLQYAKKAFVDAALSMGGDYEDNVGCMLYAMNAEAVGQRYDERNIVQEYRHERFPQHKAQVLKSARCLRYQCLEGNVPDKELFKMLERFIEALTEDLVVKHVPEYNSANWDVWEEEVIA